MNSPTAVYVYVRSCFWHHLLFLLYLVPHTWQARGIHITSCEIDYAHHAVEFLVSSYGTVFLLQKCNRTYAYCCIRLCSLVLLASSAVYALMRITYLAVRGKHFISSSIIKPEHRVLLYTLMFARAFGIFCCFCLISYHIPRSSWYTYSITSCEIDHKHHVVYFVSHTSHIIHLDEAREHCLVYLADLQNDM